MEIAKNRLATILRHIRLVQDNCEIVGNYYIDEGREEFGKDLIAHSLIHDNSKLHGVEWLYLNTETKEASPDLFKAAWTQHVTTNPHHIEYWGKIELMPEIYLVELVCDCAARGMEMGTDIVDWFKEEFCGKHKLTQRSQIYKNIKTNLNILLTPKFK